MVAVAQSLEAADAPLSFMWLEITGRCNLRCVHCYADSGPQGAPDTLGTAGWIRLLDEASALGVGGVRFIGGEPTIHPGLPQLIRHASGHGLTVEVYSNLTHVSPLLWKLFADHNVSLATSFYSYRQDVHDRITRGRGSQPRTIRSIEKAKAMGLPLRVGLVDVDSSQELEQTATKLRERGVKRLRIDRSRGIGRAVHDKRSAADNVSELCGHCTSRRIAVGPDGTAYPCVFSRWLPVGSVRTETLGAIVRSARLAQVRRELDQSFIARTTHTRQTPLADHPKPLETGPLPTVGKPAVHSAMRAVYTMHAEHPMPTIDGL
jgi:sulfatase maturation enzyme AslB (radical SAM superfamily)